MRYHLIFTSEYWDFEFDFLCVAAILMQCHAELVTDINCITAELKFWLF